MVELACSKAVYPVLLDVWQNSFKDARNPQQEDFPTQWQEVSPTPRRTPVGRVRSYAVRGLGLGASASRGVLAGSALRAPCTVTHRVPRETPEIRADGRELWRTLPAPPGRR